MIRRQFMKNGPSTFWRNIKYYKRVLKRSLNFNWILAKIVYNFLNNLVKLHKIKTFRNTKKPWIKKPQSKYVYVRLRRPNTKDRRWLYSLKAIVDFCAGRYLSCLFDCGCGEIEKVVKLKALSDEKSKHLHFNMGT